MLRTNDGTFHGNSRGREEFTTRTKEMFAAVRQDRMGEFLRRHPAVVAR
jgi:hypothetical protein